MYAILRPFRIDTEQLELLEPKERIEIEAINADLTKATEGEERRAAGINRFSLLIDINNRMSSNAKLFTDREYLETVVKPWMNIFLWYFEIGYYEDEHLQEVLIRVKEIFKLFNEVNIQDFVQWYSRFGIVFIKSALFKLQTKLIKELMKNKGRFKSKLSRFLGVDSKDRQTLSFGKLLNFYKGYNKAHFRILEEEINLLQEIYFNSSFGPNQLKTNYLIDWELQAKEIEVQEYFFNIKDNFITLNFVTSKSHIETKLPKDADEELKKIESEFVRLMLASHDDKGYQWKEEEAEMEGPAPKLMAPRDLATGLMLGGQIPLMTEPEPEEVPEIGMSKMNLANLLLGRSPMQANTATDQDHKAFDKYNQTEAALKVNLPKLTAVLRAINSLILREDLKPFKTYLEVRTGAIIQRAAHIVKQKYQKAAKTLNADEWDNLKAVVSDLIFDSRVYLSMFSKEFICYLVEVMPEHSIKELVKATIGLLEDESIGDKAKNFKQNDKKSATMITNSRPYKKSFNKLIKAFYRWMIKNTQDFEEQQDSQKDNFYIYAISILKFFDRMILYNKTMEPTLIQSEIIYFDFLFAMYTYSGAGELLRRYAELEDNSPVVEKSFNQMFVRMQTKPATFMPQTLATEKSASLKVDFIYLMALLSSMKLATNRFFTTEHSLLLKTGFDGFVRDLLQFSKHEDISFDSHDISRNLATEEKPEFGEGFINILQNEKQIRNEKNAESFLKNVDSNLKMNNKYYYMIYNLVVRLQTNLLFNTDENLLNNRTQKNFKQTSVGKFDLNWRPSEEKLIDLARNNLSPILSDCFLSKKNNEEEAAIFKSSIKSVTHQMLTMVKKFEIASYVCEEDNTEEVEKMALLSSRLREFKEVVEQFGLKLGCTTKERIEMINMNLPIEGNKIRIGYQNLLENVFHLIEDISNEYKLGFDPVEFRRQSLHSDEANLEMVTLLTKFSRKYNAGAADSTESYYRAIMAGRVEMEVDSRELNRGLARSFIKIFNKMLLNQHNYKKRFRKINANIEEQVHQTFDFIFDDDYTTLKTNMERLQAERQDLFNQRDKLAQKNQGNKFLDDAINKVQFSILTTEDKIKKVDDQIEVIQQFLLSYETNYFYNETYTKAMIIYEKLIDELPELKENIFNESFKNKGLINFEADGHGFRSTYPYLHNLYTLSLQYSYHLMTSVVFNVKWGISMSRLFITMSLINNLTLNNYQGFKEIFAEVPFNDLQLKLFQEKEQSEKESKEDSNLYKPAELQRERLPELLPDARSYEKHGSFIASICCRIEHFLAVYEFHDRDKLNSNFDSSIVTTGLPVLTLWINFLSSALVFDDSALMKRETSYVYNKLFTRYLLKMLFLHEDMISVEVVYMKKTICSLLFKLLRNEENMDNLLKYHCDFRTIYDYTLKMTKVHIACLLSADPGKKIAKWMKKNEEQRNKIIRQEVSQSKQVFNLIDLISNGLKEFTEKISKVQVLILQKQ
jgi:hypothetical protein